MCVLSCSVCNPMDCCPPDSSVHGIFQARILEWVAIFFSRGSSQPRDWTCVSKVSCIGRQILYHWATWEALDHMVSLLIIIGAISILFTIPAKLFFSSVQSVSCVGLFVTPWTTALQASLSITNSRSLFKLMSIESVMPCNHLIPCCPLLLLPSLFASIRVFSNESVFRIMWPKYWSFSFSISPSNEYSRLISLRIDWLDLLAVQGTLKSLFQHHNSTASVFQCSAFFMVQTFLHSHKQCTVFQFLCILTSICYFYVLDSILMGVRFWLASLWWLVILMISDVSICLLTIYIYSL